MELSDAILDEAYTIYEEWGPQRRVERKERLRQAFPELSNAQVDAIIKTMRRVNETVWRIAEQGGEAKLGPAKVTRLLQQEHPFLRGGGLRHAQTLVNYYAWHEGYDQ